MPALDLNQKRSAALGQIVRTKEVNLELPSAHPKQYELINAFELYPGTRFVVGACGTKFGKTYGCCIRLVKEAWENEHSLNWWVAPSYDQTLIALQLVKLLLPQGLYKVAGTPPKVILYNPDGSERSYIHFKTGDNPDTLRGYKVNFFVMDEVSRMPYEAYVSVMTTVTQTRGRGIFISTPNGRGWFYDIYQRGNKLLKDGVTPNPDKKKEWLSLSLPTSCNPHVPPESIEEAKANLPEDRFREEYLAIFRLQSAGVFNGIYDCARGNFEEPQPGHQYVVGVDLARLRDFTVLTVMDRQRKTVVGFQRFNRVEWEFQYNVIRDTCNAYNHAVAVVDATGIGDPICESLRGGGVSVEPYKIGGSTAKQQLIEKLRVAIEKGRISYPAIPELLSELEAYEYLKSESGVVRYGAPEGKHDDTVISLALATWLVDQEPFVYRFFQRRA